MDPDTRAKHTRSTEAATGKSEQRSRERPRTIVRQTGSREAAFTEAPSSINSTWAQLLSTYTWSKKPKPLETLPSRRLRLIPKPLTARETERATQWGNTRESGTGLPHLPLDIWIEVFRVGICTACNQSWHSWYCGTCNNEVPYPYHSRIPRGTPMDFSRRRQRHYPEQFLNARSRHNMAQVSRAWLYVLLLVDTKIDDLEKLIRIYKPQNGTPRHMNKTTLNILYTAEKYKARGRTHGRVQITELPATPRNVKTN